MEKKHALVPRVFSGTLVTSDHQKIAYNHYRNGNDKVVIIAHGFYNSKDAVLLTQLTDNLVDRYDVCMFDFRGHGKSRGFYTWTSKEGNDVKAVLDYVEGEYNKVGMVAFSFGGSIAINTLAHDRRVHSLICVSVACDPGKIDYQFWKLDWKGDLVYTLCTSEGRKGRGFPLGPFWLKKQRPIDSVEALQIPVLYIHGEKDWVIKPWHSQALYDKTQSRKKLVIIKNGPHAEYLMKDSREEFLREVKGWLGLTL